MRIMDIDLDGDGENIVLSDDDPYDSDIVDSDVEAELYGIVHHDTSIINSDNEELKASTSQDNSLILEKPVEIDFVTDFASDCDLYKNFQSPQQKNMSNQHSNSKSCKRKSAEMINDLDVNMNSKTSSKKQKNRNSATEKRGKNINLRTHDSDTSDSDVIWTEASDAENRFQINLMQEVFTLSTDSDSSLSSFEQNGSFSFTNERSSLSNPKDLWYVNNEDLYRSSRFSSRYHETAIINCSNCNQKGHSAKNCSTPKKNKCFICGSRHNSYGCRKRVCIKCIRVGHDFKYCQKDILKCGSCEMFGHSSQVCPDLWRRFHLTTTNSFTCSKELLQDTPLYCYNCGQQGHFGPNCRYSRMNPARSFATWPSVINCLPPVKSHKINLNNSQHSDPSLSSLENYRKVRRAIKKAKKAKLKEQRELDLSKQTDFPRTPKGSQTDRNCENDIEAEMARKEIIRNNRRQRRKLQRLRKKEMKQLIKD